MTQAQKVLLIFGQPTKLLQRRNLKRNLWTIHLIRLKSRSRTLQATLEDSRSRRSNCLFLERLSQADNTKPLID